MLSISSHSLVRPRQNFCIAALILSLGALDGGSALAQTSPNPSVCDRTPAVRDGIAARVASASGAADCAEISADQLSAIAKLDLSGQSIDALQAGDFAGLAGLTELRLHDNQLSALPSGVFNGLSQLRKLYLHRNQLSALPDGAFGGLALLQELVLGVNQLSTLPDGVFEGLAQLQVLSLLDNRLSALASGVFDNLTQLENIWLQGNQLSALPAGVFDNLTRLAVLQLHGNQLNVLPDGVFDALSQLEWLTLNGNQLSTLPSGTFDELTRLRFLDLGGNQLSALPSGIFDGSTRLRHLDLGGNQLRILPPGVFGNLIQLLDLWMSGNQLSTLPAGLFDELNQLISLFLDENQFYAPPSGLFAGLHFLRILHLQGNPADPLPLAVSLARAGADGQVKALIDSGAPFALMLPLSITNGSIADARGNAINSVAIGTGMTESAVFTATPTPSASGQVTLDIGSLPAVPSETDTRGDPLHQGYTLRKSSALPLRPFAIEPTAPPLDPAPITRWASPAPLRTASTGGATGAVFAGGATVSGGVNYLAEIPADQSVGIVGLITPDPADVGQQADIFAAVRIGDDFYYYTQSGFRSWNIDLSSTDLGLEAYERVTLPASYRLEIADLEQALGRSLDGIEGVKVHFAYSRADSNALVYSDEGVEFAVAAAPGDGCPAGAERRATPVAGGKDSCTLSGTYAQDLHLTANFDYVLSGAVFIGGDNENSAALTINAGVTVYGASGNDFLAINRGSKIHVNGSPSHPVIMTSANDGEATASTRGQWGGLIINGKAPVNGCAEGAEPCEAQGEGGAGRYGGNAPADDSGNLNYLVVKYAGHEIAPENELNGIAFQGVGGGTLVDYVQVHNSADDGVEFFGGRVNAKHLLLTGNGDDSLDWVQGWRGRVQHVVIVQTDAGDQGFEGDNLDTSPDAQPRSRPAIANVTLMGNSNTDIGVLLRAGAGANISNAVVTGFGEACLDIDDSATFANGGSSAADLSGALTMTHSIVDCETNFAEQADDNWRVSEWFGNQRGNRIGGADMSSYINSSAVNGMAPASLDDPFFDQVDYVGAVKDADSDWTQGWTFRGWEDYNSR